MTILKDKIFYDENPDTHEKTFSYVERPRILRNDLGPLQLGQLFQITIKKNDSLILSFDYNIIQAIPEGKTLMGASDFNFVDISADQEPIPVEVIACKDTRVFIEDPVTHEQVFDHIKRPTNIFRNNVGGYALGDVCEIAVLVDGQVFDSLQYTIGYVGEGKKVFGAGYVSFVEI